MRTIKFRAWDKKEQCWVGGFSIHQSGLFSDLINAHIERPQNMPIADAHWQEVPEHIVIQQFTGLKDKNGKEIYEGDIVKWSDGDYKHPHNPRIATVNLSPDIQFKTLWGVIFNYGNFAYKNTENHLEVISNIYENYELIK